MLDSMGIQVSKDAWMQILPDAAEDSIVPETAQCEEIESNIVQLRREQKRRRYWQERCKKTNAMIRKLRDELSESQSRDSCGKWFRPSGGISLALKRTVGGFAACKMGLATCQDVSVHTGLAWEHTLAASLLAQSRDFYRCHLHQLVTVKSDFFLVPRMWAIIGYRADATNKWIWADEKLHVCEVSTTCLPDLPSQYGRPEDVWECVA